MWRLRSAADAMDLSRHKNNINEPTSRLTPGRFHGFVGTYDGGAGGIGASGIIATG